MHHRRGAGSLLESNAFTRCGLNTQLDTGSVKGAETSRGFQHSHKIWPMEWTFARKVDRIDN